MTVYDSESGSGGGAQENLAIGEDRKTSPSTINSLSPFPGVPHSQDLAFAGASKLNAEGHPKLSADEEAALRLFLSHVNSWRGARGYPSLSESSATKFLMARKFQVDRALALYRQHEMMRVREGLAVNSVDPCSSPLKEELRTAKFTVLPSKDPNGAAIAVFSARLHDPSVTSHKLTLQGIVHQLDVAMEDNATQRGGLVFVYNMYGSKYANFDYDLSQKMLTLLKGCYPARLKKVLIVTAPLWFKGPFKVLRLFVREKLRDRVFTVSLPQLVLHIPNSSLPKELGGSLDHDHPAWLDHCVVVSSSRNGELVTMSSSQPSTPVRSHPTLEQLESLPVITCSNGIGRSREDSGRKSAADCLPPPPPPEDEDIHEEDNREGPNANNLSSTSNKSNSASRLSNSSDNEDDDQDPSTDNHEGKNGAFIAEDMGGMALLEFIEHTRSKGRRGLYDEYAEIKSRTGPRTQEEFNRIFTTCCKLDNTTRNRYTDVHCYDHSRVKLKGKVVDYANVKGGVKPSANDYINANFVDGYKQPSAFIFTQGPLPKTFGDFWQMVWEEKVLVVIMTTKAVEKHRTKCGQYWPDDVGSAPLVAGDYQIIAEESAEDGEGDFVVTRLRLTCNGESRSVVHFQFVSWPDYGVPDSALSMLTFLQRVRETQADMTSKMEPKWEGHPLGPPMVVHCSAGIGRTGTFATLDIAIRKFEDLGRVDIRSTVEKIRGQRAFSIQTPDQYVFCHLGFLEYALNMEHIEEIDLTGFEDDCDSE